jgi:hypothetical protein
MLCLETWGLDRIISAVLPALQISIRSDYFEYQQVHPV